MLARDPKLDDACRRLGVRLLVGFGSRAAGAPAPRPDSDVDVAVLLAGAPASRASLAELHAGLAPHFADPLDLVLLAAADPLFRWEIMDRAVLLHGDIDDFLEYRAFAYRDFVDSASLRALEDELSKRKLRRIGERIGAAS
jgi:predicted nucleotidyltransferase